MPCCIRLLPARVITRAPQRILEPMERYGTNQKRRLLACGCLGLCLLVACAAPNGTGSNKPGRSGSRFATPAPVDTPAPTAPPTLTLYGPADEAFTAGARRAAEERGYGFIAATALSSVASAAPAAPAVVVLAADVSLLPTPTLSPTLSPTPAEDSEEAGADDRGEIGESAAAETAASAATAMGADAAKSGGVYYFRADGGALPAGVNGAAVRPEDALSLALDAAVRCPPHCEPVRMLGLFSSDGSPGRALWDAACAAGRIQSRGAFFAGAQTGDALSEAAASWLKKQLSGLYVGTVDCVYAETGALAAAAVQALTDAERADAEVFCGAADADALAAMRETPGLFAAAAGPDMEAAGYACAVRALDGLPTGEETVVPRLFFGADELF